MTLLLALTVLALLTTLAVAWGATPPPLAIGPRARPGPDPAGGPAGRLEVARMVEQLATVINSGAVSGRHGAPSPARSQRAS